MEASAEIPQNVDIPNKGIEVYQIEGSRVHINWYKAKPEAKPEPEVKPETKEPPDPKKAVIFLGAWNYEADSHPLMDISQKVANGVNQNCVAISTRTDRLAADALFTESLAIAEDLVTRQGIREALIIGHSEGAIKATNLAVILEQSYPQVKIDGVVLLDPMGMHKRWIAGLALREIVDVFIGRGEFKKAKTTSPKEYVKDFFLGIWNDMRFFSRKWPEKTRKALGAMTRPNPRLKFVRSPILLVTAEKDYVSDYRQYFPKNELEKRANAPVTDEQIIDEMSQKWEKLPENEKAKFGSREGFIKTYFDLYKRQDEVTRMRHARDQYFKGEVVPASENAKVLIAASPGAHHAGLVDIRIGDVADFATRIFQRMQRKAA